MTSPKKHNIYPHGRFSIELINRLVKNGMSIFSCFAQKRGKTVKVGAMCKGPHS
jgi:hypothetical protein